MPVQTPFSSLSSTSNAEQIKSAIVYLASNTELAKTLIDLSVCESGLRPTVSIIDTNGKESAGLFQFQMSTFYTFGRGDWRNPKDQIRTALKMIKMGRGGVDWVNCWKIIHK